MPFTLIRGAFHVQNYSPDGDSIRFRPDDPDLVRGLQGSKPRFNGRKHVQLRIEAIDGLETHYNPPNTSVTLHQPLDLAHRATDRLLDFVGIRNVVWDNARRTVVSADDGTRGYILSRSVEKNGRPVAFVFAGDPAEADGSSIVLRAPRLRESHNHAALAEGLAYATYYRGLFNDLRDALTQAVSTARTGNLGVYANDRTNAGFQASSLSIITDEAPILPKLFRRLSEYMVNFGSAVGFKAKLAQSQEPVLDLRDTNFTHFDTFVQQANNSDQISLTRRPEELVFDEMPTRPPNAFSLLMADEEVAPPDVLAAALAPDWTRLMG